VHLEKQGQNFLCGHGTEPSGDQESGHQESFSVTSLLFTWRRAHRQRHCFSSAALLPLHCWPGTVAFPSTHRLLSCRRCICRTVLVLAMNHSNISFVSPWRRRKAAVMSIGFTQWRCYHSGSAAASAAGDFKKKGPRVLAAGTLSPGAASRS
jgi:hypothetical protein